MNELDILSRQLAREKMARKEAETIAETKSRVLYQINLDLRKLSDDLIDREKNTRAILEATADGIIVMNDEYNVVLCNQASCNLFHYQTDDLVGKNITDLIQFTELSKKTNSIISFFERQKENLLHEFTAIREDKTTIPVELSYSRVRLSQSLSIIFVIRNIFARKQAEQREAVQHKITRLMAEYSSLDKIAPQIIKIMCETMQLQEGGLWKMDPISKVLRCVDTWGIDNKKITEFAAQSKKMTFTEGLGLPGRVWKNKKVSWIFDVAKDDNFPRAKNAKKAGLFSAFAFPIFFEGEILAVIEFFIDKLYPFDQELIQFIEDMMNQLGIFIEREQAQKSVATLSRLSGMSQVASSVLHNVGNTLNSINISIELIDNKINNSKIAHLSMLSNAINEHANDMVSFIQNNPKGQNFAEFLALISDTLNDEKKYFISELDLLKKNVEHVKQIIEMQQSVSYEAGLAEEVLLRQLMENSIAMNKLAIEQANIKVMYDFKSVKKVTVNKSKLTQIILNLVKNGIDALIDSDIAEKQLILAVYEHDKDHVIIEVIDNGVGILPHDLTKIFSVGFTTKAFGHGFGLHTSAIFATEIGGNLSAYSNGQGHGAIFTLMLPYG